MLEGIKAVLFDLDGTLVNSMWVWGDIDIEYLGRYGFQVPADMNQEIEGMGFTETAAYFKKRFQIPETIEEIKAEWNQMAYDKYANEVFLKPGAAEFLKKLKNSGIRMGIASSNSRELIRACLKNNQVETFFESITISCDVAQGKPAPDVYLAAAAALGISPGECLVFEDVPMGIQAGIRAGMKVCAVKDQFSLNQTDMIRKLADYYICSYEDIINKTYEVL